MKTINLTSSAIAPETVEKIHTLRMQRLTYRKIAEMTGVSATAAQKLCKGVIAQPEYVIGADGNSYASTHASPLAYHAPAEVKPYIPGEKTVDVPKYNIVGVYSDEEADAYYGDRPFEAGGDAFENWKEPELGNIDDDVLEGLNPDQTEAVKSIVYALDKRLWATGKQEQVRMILTGPAGSGKTFAITRLIKARPDIEVLFLSPTHKAAQVLRAGLKRNDVYCKVSTVHSYLALKLDQCLDTGEERFKQDIDKRPSGTEYDLIVIDEASMLTPHLIDYIENLKTPMILMTGDEYQINPVGYPKVSPALTEWGTKVELKQVMRQAEGSPILDLATAVRGLQDGTTTKIDWKTSLDANGNGVHMLPVKEWKEQLIKDMTATAKEKTDDVMVIAHKNETVHKINRIVHNKVFGKDAPPYCDGERLILQAPVIRANLNNNDIVQVIGTPKLISSASELEDAIGDGYSCDEGQYDDGKIGAHFKWHFNTLERFSATLYFWLVRVRPLTSEVYDADDNEEGDNDVYLVLIHKDSEPELARVIEEAAERAKSFPKKKPGEDPKSPQAQARRRAWATWFGLKHFFDHVKHSFAMTAHKSQGSTFNTTYVDLRELLSANSGPEQQRLLYTALTRASANVKLPIV